MPNQRWELKTVEVDLGLDLKETDFGGGTMARWELRDHTPTANDSTAQQMLQAEELAAQGWELVSVVPVNKAKIYFLSGTEFAGGAGGASYTKKLLLFFKRPLQD